MKNSIGLLAKSLKRAAILLEWKARRARRDADAFAEFAFTDGAGRPLRQAAVHRDLQRFLDSHSRALVELPRDHGKTMQVCARVLWELGRRPDLRVKLVCATEALAAERGRFLRNAVAHNERLRMVFPHLRPAHPWSAERFTVNRPAEVIGPSVTAFGVGAASTGTRADLLVCDDIVDVKSVRSRADRERVKVFYRDNLVNLLEPDGRLWNIFTPWHGDDLNSQLKKNRAYAHFRRAVGDDLQPVWPEKWPRERLVQRRQEIGELSFTRAYRLACVSDEAVIIRPESVQFWSEPEPANLTVLAIDPAVSTKRSADCSALVALARGDDGKIRCLEALAHRVRMPELIDLIDDADRRLKPDVILLEANAAFQGLYDLLVSQTRFGGKVVGIPQSKDKVTRVNIFSTPVRNGNFRLMGERGGVDASQRTLFDEITTFPVGEHDDLLDAAAMGTAWLLTSTPQVRIIGEP
jgi:predicted phage terminase large subunit-like protein